MQAWDVPTGRTSWTWPFPPMQDVVAMTFTPDGSRLVLSLAENSQRDARNELLVLDAADGRVLKRHELDTATGHLAAVHSGKAVVTSVGRMLDLDTGELTGSGFNSGQSGTIAAARTRPLVAFGSAAVQLWDHGKGEELSPCCARPARSASPASPSAMTARSSPRSAARGRRSTSCTSGTWPPGRSWPPCPSGSATSCASAPMTACCTPACATTRRSPRSPSRGTRWPRSSASARAARCPRRSGPVTWEASPIATRARALTGRRRVAGRAPARSG
ncbi:hypothetical protein ACFQ0B_38885 [Nonomuraea thailandensis]